jgi:phosphoribosylglycinamide formyltransferase-1
MNKTIRIAVFASGRGSDFQSIIDGVAKGEVNAKIELLVTDNPSAYAIERAKQAGIAYVVFEPKNYATREQFDEAIMTKVDSISPDLVVLAGYMRIIRSKEFLQKYSGKILNIHPSLLPKYPGAHAQKDAFEAGEKVSGLTIHFVDDSLDGGPIIYQEKVDISDCKSADEVSAKILGREHDALPKIVDSFSKGKYMIEGKKVKYEKR